MNSLSHKAGHSYDADPDLLLPREAAQLLAVMLRQSSVCQCSREDLAEKLSDTRRAVDRLLRFLTAIGFLSKERSFGAAPNVYCLHLPPLERR
jgi:hypothetical protein